MPVSDVPRKAGFSCAIRPDLQYLPWVRRLVPAVLDQHGRNVSPRARWTLTLIVVEAVTNAIVHRPRDEAEGWIELTLTLTARKLQLAVTDTNAAFRLPPEVLPPPQQERGRGLFLIRQLCQKVVLHRLQGRNRLTMYYDASEAAHEDYDHQALQAMHRLSQAIVGVPNIAEVCEQILREAVRMIPVSKASIMQYDATDRTLRVIAARGIPKRIQRTARVKVGEGVSGQVFATGKPLLVEDIRELTGVPRRRRYRGHSLIAAPMTSIPLQVRGVPLGIINMTDKKDGTPFTARDLALLNTLANQAAAYMHLCSLADHVAVARETDRELSIAREIQAGLLPAGRVRMRGCEAIGFCLPSARVGGDYFDYFPQGTHGPGAVIADVAGHNVGAALTMAGLRGLLRSEMGSGHASVAQVMDVVNQQLYGDLARAEQIISAILLWYRADQQTFHYAVAGHPPPLLWSSRLRRVSQLGGGDGLMGITKDASFTSHAVAVECGDVLLLYTDGVMELADRRGRAFGLSRLKRALSAVADLPPPQMLKGLKACLMQYAGQGPYRDDVTAVMIKVL